MYVTDTGQLSLFQIVIFPVPLKDALIVTAYLEIYVQFLSVYVQFLYL